TITFVQPKTVTNKKRLAAELYPILKPKPNTGWFKLRLRLHNAIAPLKKKKGFKYWLKYKLGQAPAILTKPQAERNKLLLEKSLQDKGYFGASVTYETKVKKKKVKINYRMETKGQYRLNNIVFSDDSTSIGRLFLQHREDSFLKKDQPYQKSNLDAERMRLANLAGDAGYFDFTQEYIYFIVDTLASQLKADIYVEVKPTDDGRPHRIYEIGNTQVISNYDLNEPSLSFKDTLRPRPHFEILRNDEVLKPSTTNRMILQNKGDRYSKKIQDVSLNHLLDLGVFKFVNLKYVKSKDTLQNRLDRYFYLTPALVSDISMELELNNRTGNYLGTAATFSYLHKNLFKGAENLNLSLSGGVETQFGNDLAVINTIDVNLGITYSIPRFLLPFKKNDLAGFFVPKTLFSLSNRFQNRQGFFTVNRIASSFGYDWKVNRKKRHQFNPIDIQIVRVFNRTEAFNDFLADKPRRLRESFENTLIAGLDYTFSYSNQNVNPRRSNIFFNGNFRTAGNLLRGVTSIFSGPQEGAYSFLGQEFAQFVRVQGELRIRRNLPKGKLIFRLHTGIGLPYGNANVLPYSEQFFVGGANSMRGFRLRGLGPGSFEGSTAVGEPGEGEEAIPEQFLDQTGDLRLESNIEYRFGLSGYLKGAVFLDMGNVWLLESEDTPEGVFQLDQFYRQIAFNTGMGLRFDIDYAVLRFDLGLVLRKVYPGDGFQWSFSRWDFSDKENRGEHLNFLLALGYPF
ncbi:MAG: BamA/TamA family outer membrane protein, partial [Bacteroidota bacterium]